MWLPANDFRPAHRERPVPARRPATSVRADSARSRARCRVPNQAGPPTAVRRATPRTPPRLPNGKCPHPPSSDSARQAGPWHAHRRCRDAPLPHRTTNSLFAGRCADAAARPFARPPDRSGRRSTMRRSASVPVAAACVVPGSRAARPAVPPADAALRPPAWPPRPAKRDKRLRPVRSPGCSSPTLRRERLVPIPATLLGGPVTCRAAAASSWQPA